MTGFPKSMENWAYNTSNKIYGKRVIYYSPIGDNINLIQLFKQTFLSF